MEMSNRIKGKPIVKDDRSFLEIVGNFTDPREVLREAISNSLDWSADTIKITVYLDATSQEKGSSHFGTLPILPDCREISLGGN